MKSQETTKRENTYHHFGGVLLVLGHLLLLLLRPIVLVVAVEQGIDGHFVVIIVGLLADAVGAAAALTRPVLLGLLLLALLLELGEELGFRLLLLLLPLLPISLDHEVDALRLTDLLDILGGLLIEGALVGHSTPLEAKDEIGLLAGGAASFPLEGGLEGRDRHLVEGTVLDVRRPLGLYRKYAGVESRPARYHEDAVLQNGTHEHTGM